MSLYVHKTISLKSLRLSTDQLYQCRDQKPAFGKPALSAFKCQDKIKVPANGCMSGVPSVDVPQTQ